MFEKWTVFPSFSRLIMLILDSWHILQLCDLRWSQSSRRHLRSARWPGVSRYSTLSWERLAGERDFANFLANWRCDASSCSWLSWCRKLVNDNLFHFFFLRLFYCVSASKAWKNGTWAMLGFDTCSTSIKCHLVVMTLNSGSSAALITSTSMIMRHMKELL